MIIKLTVLTDWYLVLHGFKTSNVPVFKPWRTRYESVNYGLVIKCRPSFKKSKSLVLIRLVLTEIQPFENEKIYTEM